MKKKRKFRIEGFIYGIGFIEEYRWAYSPKQAVKIIARYYEKRCFRVKIFIENRRVWENINDEWILVLD